MWHHHIADESPWKNLKAVHMDKLEAKLGEEKIAELRQQFKDCKTKADADGFVRGYLATNYLPHQQIMASSSRLSQSSRVPPNVP